MFSSTPITIRKALLKYQTVDNAEWQRLLDPVPHSHNVNIRNVSFMSGLHVTRWNADQYGVCEVDMDVKPTNTEWEATTFSIECEVSSVRSLKYFSKKGDRQPGEMWCPSLVHTRKRFISIFFIGHTVLSDPRKRVISGS